MLSVQFKEYVYKEMMEDHMGNEACFSFHEKLITSPWLDINHVKRHFWEHWHKWFMEVVISFRKVLDQVPEKVPL